MRQSGERSHPAGARGRADGDRDGAFAPKDVGPLAAGAVDRDGDGALVLDI